MPTALPDQGTGVDRRNAKRTHVLFSGRLIASGESAEGVLLDISATGARIQLASPFDGIGPMILRLARNVDFRVEAIWRKDRTLGLRFRDAAARNAAILAGLLAQDSLAA